jgi:anti-anti-sigma factor
MPVTPLEASVRFQPGAAIIDLHGEIDATGEQVLNAAYVQANSQNPSTVLLNFADVKYIDTTGIALIVGLLAQARKVRRRLVVCGLSDHYVEVFQITRLAEFMHLFPDETAALTDMPSPQSKRPSD